LLQIYVLAIAALALPFLWRALPSLPLALTNISFLLFFVFTTIAEKSPVSMPLQHLGDEEGQAVAVSTAFYFAAIIIFGTHGAVLLATLAVGVGELLRRKSPLKIIFNISHYIICTGVAGVAYTFFARSSDFYISSNWVGLLAAAACFLGLNVFFTLAVVSLAIDKPLLEIWQMTNKTVIVHDAALYPLGAMAAFIYQREPLAIILLFLPLMIIHYAFETFSNLQVETRRALETFADAIDRRDEYTYHHSQRVAELTQRLGEKMGLPITDIAVAVSAARIHDLGKVAWSNNILTKPGPLTEEEWETVRQHPMIAVEMLENLSLYERGVPLIRHHHERIDGTGYPDGLAGEEIPLGARLIAVADSYDAMTTDRPYRRGLSHDEAIARLREGMGTQFDSRVVEAFCELWEEEEVEFLSAPLVQTDEVARR
jgi:hypothetical protein